MEPEDILSEYLEDIAEDALDLYSRLQEDKLAFADVKHRVLIILNRARKGLNRDIYKPGGA